MGVVNNRHDGTECVYCKKCSKKLNGSGNNVKRVKPSWANLLTASILRVVIGAFLCIVAMERIYNWKIGNHISHQIEFILVIAFFVAALSLISAIFALVGILQDPAL